MSPIHSPLPPPPPLPQSANFNSFGRSNTLDRKPKHFNFKSDTPPPNNKTININTNSTNRPNSKNNPFYNSLERKTLLTDNSKDTFISSNYRIFGNSNGNNALKSSQPQPLYDINFYHYIYKKRSNFSKFHLIVSYSYE